MTAPADYYQSLCLEIAQAYPASLVVLSSPFISLLSSIGEVEEG